MPRMELWWAAISTAFGWSFVVWLWESLTRKVPNELVVVGGIAAAVLTAVDQQYISHGEGLGVTLLPIIALYAMGLVSAGTAKGFGAVGAMVGFGAAPALWGIMLLSIILKKIRKKPINAGAIYLLGIIFAVVLHATHVTREAL
jgi:Flp pilus assembly protein protease CpaA